MNTPVELRRPPATAPVMSAEVPPQLRAMVESELASHYGVPRPIARIERCRGLYQSSFSLDDLDVFFEDGSGLALVCKDVSRRAMLPEARRIKPKFLYNPRREIDTYRNILDSPDLGTATFYGGSHHASEAGGHRWLLLERVAGCPLWQVGDFSVWEAVARWLALLHVRLGGRIGPEQQAAPGLLTYDREFYRVWLRRAVAFHTAAGTASGAAAHSVIKELARRFDSVIDLLLSLPTSIIHGDFYSSNVVIERRGGLRVCAVDWEMAAIGPPMIDLAAFTAGKWTDKEQVALARAYWAGLRESGRDCLDWEQFSMVLDCCRLHLAVQNLGWARDWTPPVEHAHDWMDDVLQLLDRLDI